MELLAKNRLHLRHQRGPNYTPNFGSTIALIFSIIELVYGRPFCPKIAISAQPGKRRRIAAGPAEPQGGLCIRERANHRTRLVGVHTHTRIGPTYISGTYWCTCTATVSEITPGFAAIFRALCATNGGLYRLSYNKLARKKLLSSDFASIYIQGVL